MTPNGAVDPVSDQTLLEEIELVADLLVAVSRANDRHLSQDEIDEALGLCRATKGSPGASGSGQPNRPEM